jgi:hypothetical protein
MHRYKGRSNALVGSPLFPSWPGYITNTSGYDFRKGQERCLQLAKANRNAVVAELFEQLAEQWLRLADNIEHVETYLALRQAMAHRRR